MGLSHGDVEHRTGLLRCSVSGVENDHTLPNLKTLEKWNKGLDVELRQLFRVGEGRPQVPKAAESGRLRAGGKELSNLFDRMSKPNQQVLVDTAHKLVSPEAPVAARAA
jgi:transcriptional regulator with XRE-family HTH domain